MSHDEIGALKQVEKLMGSAINREQVLGFEAAAVAPPLPMEEPRPLRQPRNNKTNAKQPEKFQGNANTSRAKSSESRRSESVK